MALWWVPSNHIPGVEEAKERLDFLRVHGETAYAFSFKKPFPMPQAASNLPAAFMLMNCNTSQQEGPHARSDS
jgi:Domain of unknown function (DUF3291)